MKRKWIIIAAMMLTVAMLFSLPLVGCKTTSAETTTAAAETTTAAAETTTAAAETTTAAAETTTAAAETTTAAASGNPNDFTEAKIDWQKYKGTELRVMYPTHMFTDAIKPMIPDFEKLTGIKITLEEFPEQEYWNKLMVEFSGGANAPDVFMVNAPRITTFDAGGWIQDITPLLNDPNLTDSKWFDFGDFFASGLDSGKYKDKQYGLPVTGEWQIIFYRKDLYAQKNLKVPETMDDLYNNAKAINSEQVAGIVNRLSRSGTAWWPWAGFVGAYDGYWVDPKSGQPQLESQPVKDATNMYVKLLKDSGPAGAVNYDWNESLTEFQQGRAAHFVDSSVFMSEFEDPSKSVVSGKVGYAPMVPGKAGSQYSCNLNYWMQGMSAKTKNKEAAWLYMQWATCKETALKIALEKGTAARSSIWENPEFLSVIPKDFASACAKGAELGKKDLVPEVKELGEIAEYACIALNQIYMGEKTLDQALGEAQTKTLTALGKK